MKNAEIPQLSEQEVKEGLISASNSPRRRYPKILHKPGEEFNRVVNFILRDSYMQPHLHPGEEKIEEIHLIQGKILVLFFDGQGAVSEGVLLEKGGIEVVKVPAFTWHTYIMLSEFAISYETMMGRYDPQTWKEFAKWAPSENSLGTWAYVDELKRMYSPPG